MANWYSINLGNAGGGDEHTLPSGCCFPFKYGGIEFDKNNYIYRGYVRGEGSPTRYRIIPYSGAPSIWIKASTTSLTGDPKRTYLTGYPGLYITDNNLPSELSTERYVKLETTTISGKFRFGEVVASTYHSHLDGGTIPVNVAINGTNFRAVCLVAGKSVWDSTAYTFNKRTGSSIAVYNEYAEPYMQPTDFTLLTTGYDNSELKSEYKNMVWDFGSVPQEVPVYFKNFMDNASTPIYENSFTVKNQNGTEELAQIIEAPTMVKGNLTVIGNRKTLVLTGGNDENYTLIWDSITPEGKQFTGISFSPNSTIANIPIGIDTYFNLEGDVSLYESYGVYRPPVTTFDVNLYHNSAEPHRLDKTDYLTAIDTLEGVLRDESSITDMVITFESTSVPNFNYVYIPAFNRYYFVNDITSLKYKLWQVSLSVDTLMTYKNAILACKGFVDRNERASSPMIVDKKRVVRSGKTISYTAIPNELFTETNGWYVLNGLALSTHGGE